eukprot:Tbor_TRINITY_DN5288_c1_g6::TRINITY_DN5288_c1_g6_i1::g.16348::m.16348/K01424/E3.5.1.1, ansA, ansB; L-asparaginase
MITSHTPVSNNLKPRVLVINITGSVLNLDKIEDLKHKHIPCFDVICTSSHPYRIYRSSETEENEVPISHPNNLNETEVSLPKTVTSEIESLEKQDIQISAIIDSKKSNIVLSTPSFLTCLIADKYHLYDGFIIIHDTQNMAYTASALSFMLTNLWKPVIFTGNRIPVEDVHSDLSRNLILSILIAASTSINEVMILFAEELFRANRTTKVSSVSLQPFASPNFPSLARGSGLGTNMIRKKYHMKTFLNRNTCHSPLAVHTSLYENILVLKMTPVLSGILMINLIRETKVKGIIFCGFGTGNFTPEVNDVADEARRRNIIMVICSQVRYGWIDLSSYEPGRRLTETGVLSAGDMTLEAATAKLAYLLDLGYSTEDVKRLFVTDLKGELTQASSKL